MAAVAINRLRVRGPPENASRARFLIEDACRTGLPVGERLVLVRKMMLGPQSTAGQPSARVAAIRHAYEDATRDARHGSSDGAAGANSVWFASRAEARRLLLQVLLAGRVPHGWFWRLAVPEWRGQPIAQWLGLLLEQGEGDAHDSDILDLLVMAAESGAADKVLEALAATVPASGSQAPHSFALAAGTFRSPNNQAPARNPVVHVARMLDRIRDGIPVALARSVEALVRQIGVTSRTAALLLERLLVRASPTLALSNALLQDLVGAYVDLLAQPVMLSPIAHEGRSPPQGEARFTTAVSERSPLEPAARRGSSPDDLPPAAPTNDPAEAPLPILARAGDSEEPPPSWLATVEVLSAAAGLWLVLPSLIRLGVREWLAERPELLAADAGRTLIRTIGVHHRVAPDDPALQPIFVDEDPSLPPYWALLWRVGLDRWLRRRARLSLSRLIWKPGWIRLSEDRLIVRFAPESADIRLRRIALDVDPGWTDWLGLSVRYRYAPKALP